MSLSLPRLFIEYSKKNPTLVRQRPEFVHFLTGGMAVKLFLQARKMPIHPRVKETSDFDFVFAVPKKLSPTELNTKFDAMDRLMSRHVNGFGRWLTRKYKIQNTISKKILVPPVTYNPIIKKQLYKVIQYKIYIPGQPPEGLVDASLTYVPGVQRGQLLHQYTAAFGMPIQQVKYLYKGVLAVLASSFSSFAKKNLALGSRNPLLGNRAEKGLKNTARIANLIRAHSSATTAAKNLVRHIRTGNVKQAFRNASRVIKNLGRDACYDKTEQDVHNHCIESHLRRGWKIAAHEWQVVPSKEKYGRGDLVFIKNKEYRVIECKRKFWPNVIEQAKFYGAAWKMLYAKPGYIVRYGIWTCSVKRTLGTVKNPMKLCTRPSVCRIISKRKVK